MKRIGLFLSAFIILSSIFPFKSEATCRPFDLEDKREMVAQCSEGKTTPVGWGAVRSGARLTEVSKGNIKNFVKSSNAKQATKDFAKVAPGARQQKYLKPYGTITFVNFPPQEKCDCIKHIQPKQLLFGGERKKCAIQIGEKV